MNVDLSKKTRDQVIAWLNSKNRDLEKGFEIMQKTGYKPEVLSIFMANKNRRDIPEKLVIEVRNYLRYHGSPQNPIHQDLLPGKKTVTSEELKDFFVENYKKHLTKGYPAVINEIITAHAKCYQNRSILHKKLKKAGEGASDDENKNRSEILNEITDLSTLMDSLWFHFENFKKTGILPTVDVSKLLQKKKAVKIEPKPEEVLVLSDDVDVLRKQSENWRIKLFKAENRLLYQSEKKLKEENPMPEGPKKISLKKRIAQLRKEKLAIDTKLAELK